MSPLPILGVSEIVLSVADLLRMREFYRRVLGFELHSELSMETDVADPAGKPTITFLTICRTDTPLGHDRHPQMLVLIDYRRHVFAKKRFFGHDVSRSTLNHMAFEILPDDYEGHAARLADLGIDVTFTTFPDLHARAMFFKDPEGNVLELICHDPVGE